MTAVIGSSQINSRLERWKNNRSRRNLVFVQPGVESFLVMLRGRLCRAGGAGPVMRFGSGSNFRLESSPEKPKRGLDVKNRQTGLSLKVSFVGKKMGLWFK